MRPQTVDVDIFRVSDAGKAFENFTSLVKTVIRADTAAVDAAMKRNAKANKVKRGRASRVMPKEDSGVPPDPQFIQFLLDDPTVPTVYANTLNVIVADSDIAIAFGIEPVGGTAIRPSVKVVLSHITFMRMMEHLAARYRFLETVYGSKVPSLKALDPDLVQRAMAEMLAPQSAPLSEGSSK